MEEESKGYTLWMPDDKCKACYQCNAAFTTLRRRHHCRLCGQIFCSTCCSNFSTARLPGFRAAGQRLCNACFVVAETAASKTTISSPTLSLIKAPSDLQATHYMLRPETTTPVANFVNTTHNVHNIKYANINGHVPCHNECTLGSYNYRENTELLPDVHEVYSGTSDITATQGKHFVKNNVEVSKTSNLLAENTEDNSVTGLHACLPSMATSDFTTIRENMAQPESVWPSLLKGMEGLLLDRRSALLPHLEKLIGPQEMAKFDPLVVQALLLSQPLVMQKPTSPEGQHFVCDPGDESLLDPIWGSADYFRDFHKLWIKSTKHLLVSTESHCHILGLPLSTAAMLARFGLSCALLLTYPFHRTPLHDIKQGDKFLSDDSIVATVSLEADFKINNGETKTPKSIVANEADAIPLSALSFSSSAYVAVSGGSAQSGTPCGSSVTMENALSMLSSNRNGKKDVLTAITIRHLPGGELLDSFFVPGVVILKRFTCLGISGSSDFQNGNKISAGRILLLVEDLTFDRGRIKYTTLEALEQQERIYMSLLVERIRRCRIGVLMCHGNVCSAALTDLRASGVSVMMDVSMELLFEVSRATGSRLIPSVGCIAFVNEQPQGIGTYLSFETCTIPDYHGPVLLLRGSRIASGCTICLRGTTHLAAALEIALKRCIRMAYSLRFESCFLFEVYRPEQDSKGYIFEESVDTSFSVASLTDRTDKRVLEKLLLNSMTSPSLQLTPLLLYSRISTSIDFLSHNTSGRVTAPSPEQDTLIQDFSKNTILRPTADLSRSSHTFNDTSHGLFAALDSFNPKMWYRWRISARLDLRTYMVCTSTFQQCRPALKTYGIIFSDTDTSLTEFLQTCCLTASGSEMKKCPSLRKWCKAPLPQHTLCIECLDRRLLISVCTASITSSTSKEQAIKEQRHSLAQHANVLHVGSLNDKPACCPITTELGSVKSLILPSSHNRLVLLKHQGPKYISEYDESALENNEWSQRAHASTFYNWLWCSECRREIRQARLITNESLQISFTKFIELMLFRAGVDSFHIHPLSLCFSDGHTVITFNRQQCKLFQMLRYRYTTPLVNALLWPPLAMHFGVEPYGTHTSLYDRFWSLRNRSTHKHTMCIAKDCTDDVFLNGVADFIVDNILAHQPKTALTSIGNVLLHLIQCLNFIQATLFISSCCFRPLYNNTSIIESTLILSACSKIKKLQQLQYLRIFLLRLVFILYRNKDTDVIALAVAAKTIVTVVSFVTQLLNSLFDLISNQITQRQQQLPYPLCIMDASPISLSPYRDSAAYSGHIQDHISSLEDTSLSAAQSPKSTISILGPCTTTTNSKKSTAVHQDDSMALSGEESYLTSSGYFMVDKKQQLFYTRPSSEYCKMAHKHSPALSSDSSSAISQQLNADQIYMMSSTATMNDGKEISIPRLSYTESSINHDTHSASVMKVIQQQSPKSSSIQASSLTVIRRHFHASLLPPQPPPRLSPCVSTTHGPNLLLPSPELNIVNDPHSSFLLPKRGSGSPLNKNNILQLPSLVHRTSSLSDGLVPMDIFSQRHSFDEACSKYLRCWLRYLPSHSLSEKLYYKTPLWLFTDGPELCQPKFKTMIKSASNSIVTEHGETHYLKRSNPILNHSVSSSHLHGPFTHRSAYLKSCTQGGSELSSIVMLSHPDDTVYFEAQQSMITSQRFSHSIAHASDFQEQKMLTSLSPLSRPRLIRSQSLSIYENFYTMHSGKPKEEERDEGNYNKFDCKRANMVESGSATSVDPDCCTSLSIGLRRRAISWCSDLVDSSRFHDEDDDDDDDDDNHDGTDDQHDNNNYLDTGTEDDNDFGSVDFSSQRQSEHNIERLNGTYASMLMSHSLMYKITGKMQTPSTGPWTRLPLQMHVSHQSEKLLLTTFRVSLNKELLQHGYCDCSTAKGYLEYMRAFLCLIWLKRLLKRQNFTAPLLGPSAWYPRDGQYNNFTSLNKYSLSKEPESRWAVFDDDIDGAMLFTQNVIHNVRNVLQLTKDYLTSTSKLLLPFFNSTTKNPVTSSFPTLTTTLSTPFDVSLTCPVNPTDIGSMIAFSLLSKTTLIEMSKLLEMYSGSSQCPIKRTATVKNAENETLNAAETYQKETTSMSANNTFDTTKQGALLNCFFSLDSSILPLVLNYDILKNTNVFKNSTEDKEAFLGEHTEHGSNHDHHHPFTDDEKKKNYIELSSMPWSVENIKLLYQMVIQSDTNTASTKTCHTNTNTLASTPLATNNNSTSTSPNSTSIITTYFDSHATHITVKIYFPLEFHALRHYFCGDDLNFIRSMSSSKALHNTGGKSQVLFYKTDDQRYIIKQLNRQEFRWVLTNGKQLLTFFADRCLLPIIQKECCCYSTMNDDNPSLPSIATLLTPLYGIFSISCIDGDLGKSTRHFAVMQNLKRDATIASLSDNLSVRIFDLKGVGRQRYLPPAHSLTQQNIHSASSNNISTYIKNSNLTVEDALSPLLTSSQDIYVDPGLNPGDYYANSSTSTTIRHHHHRRTLPHCDDKFNYNTMTPSAVITNRRNNTSISNAPFFLKRSVSYGCALSLMPKRKPYGVRRNHHSCYYQKSRKGSSATIKHLTGPVYKKHSFNNKPFIHTAYHKDIDVHQNVDDLSADEYDEHHFDKHNGRDLLSFSSMLKHQRSIFDHDVQHDSATEDHYLDTTTKTSTEALKHHKFKYTSSTQALDDQPIVKFCYPSFKPFAHSNITPSKTIRVWWDQNYREWTGGLPLLLETQEEESWLRDAIESDVEFLSKLGVIDYSILIVIDMNQRAIYAGIIDFFRPYTWDKQFETVGKQLASMAIISGVVPTVVSPNEYRDRLKQAMRTFFSGPFPCENKKNTFSNFLLSYNDILQNINFAKELMILSDEENTQDFLCSQIEEDQKCLQLCHRLIVDIEELRDFYYPNQK